MEYHGDASLVCAWSARRQTIVEDVGVLGRYATTQPMSTGPIARRTRSTTKATPALGQMHHGKQTKMHGIEAARQSLRGEGRSHRDREARVPELDQRIREEKNLQIWQEGKVKRRENEQKVEQLPLDTCRHLRSG